MKEKAKKLLFFIIKLSITLWAIITIVKLAELPQIWHYLKTSNLALVFLAFLILNLGQTISAMRMRYYFSLVKFKMSRFHAVLLYFTGNLFNLILPGAIGGDGYKAYLAKKYGGLKLTTGAKVMLSNRGNGFLLLIIITIFLSLFSQKFLDINYYVPLSIIAIVTTLITYHFVAKILLKESLKTQVTAAQYSFFIQISVLFTAYFLLKGADVNENILEYLILFMISSIVSVLPVSIGGIGLRELTFFKGASLLGLDPELGVAISIVYFVINSVSSLVGLACMPQLKKLEKK